MVFCSFMLNRLTLSTFTYDGTECRAFSGDGVHRNNPDSVGVADGGPIPTGRYYIVARESGGAIGTVVEKVFHRDEWFALYRFDGSIDDETFVNGVRRGEFRLHPIGPRRTSHGCITLQDEAEFRKMRYYLLEQFKNSSVYIPSTGSLAYGIVQVMVPSFSYIVGGSGADRAGDLLK
jgi:Protein of unknown function (DUF2778)